MAGLSAFLFGVVGLFLIGLMQLVSIQSFAEDSVHKHGIAEMEASRLGGAATILGGIFLIVMLAFSGLRGNSSGPLDVGWFAWVAVIGCMVLGLVEDIRNDSLSPRVRLAAKTSIFTLVLWLSPTLVPSAIGVPVIDSLLAVPAIAFVLCVVFCVGFLNAVNMADGANGLVSSIVVMANVIFYQELGGLGFLTVLTCTFVFLIFNVISGRLFLGDAGAYGMGACLLISALYCFSYGYMSLSFLAALLSYPCLDFLFSILRRFATGRSITKPDNDHLHNRIHFQYRKIFRSKNLANSASGLTVAAASSGVVLLGYLSNWWPITSEQWVFVFATQCLVYGLAYYTTGRTASQVKTA
jgi:UDP-N-acetylmuramyl pentapeptide phosphotransferase/UDP-N-acetylglucosamine-1-phosphate transferase